MLWSSLNRFLDRLRPRHQAVVLLADAGLILLAWHLNGWHDWNDGGGHGHCVLGSSK